MKNKDQSIHVLFTAAEADPYVKIGGLGDVAGSLPQAIHQYLVDQKHATDIDLRVVLPLHQQIREKIQHLAFLGEYELKQGSRIETVQVYQDQAAMIPVYLIDGEPIRKTSTVYSLDSRLDAEKYIFFSLAILQLPAFLQWRLDILHANDWHTAISIYALKEVPGFADPAVQTVLSIHNLPYFGEGCQPTLNSYEIEPINEPLLPEWARHLPFPMGLATADLLIPVSPGYATEILTPEFGYGLETLLQSKKSQITGILNGINQEQWNPATDPYIAFPYDAEHLEQKIENKKQILEDFGLNPDLSIPLVLLISRMDHQKGVDIAVNALQEIINVPWQAILLGSGDPTLESATMELQQQLPGRVHTIIGFKSELSHQLYAAGDIFLMPSRYEPCGVSQLIAMRYGMIPVAHATGGLRNTIQPITSKKSGSGYLYHGNTAQNLSLTLRTAISGYAFPETWRIHQQIAMKTNFSWENSAKIYIQKYKALSRKINPKPRMEE